MREGEADHLGAGSPGEQGFFPEEAAGDEGGAEAEDGSGEEDEWMEAFGWGFRLRHGGDCTARCVGSGGPGACPPCFAGGGSTGWVRSYAAISVAESMVPISTRMPPGAVTKKPKRLPERSLGSGASRP